LPTTNARKPTKGSADSDYSLVSIKNLRQEIGSCGGDPEPDDVIQKCANLLPL